MTSSLTRVNNIRVGRTNEGVEYCQQPVGTKCGLHQHVLCTGDQVHIHAASKHRLAQQCTTWPAPGPAWHSPTAYPSGCTSQGNPRPLPLPVQACPVGEAASLRACCQARKTVWTSTAKASAVVQVYVTKACGACSISCGSAACMTGLDYFPTCTTHCTRCNIQCWCWSCCCSCPVEQSWRLAPRK